MQFVSAKQTDISLAGVNIDVENRDGNLFSLTFTDATGKILKVSKNNYSEMSAFIPAPPKMVKKFTLTFKVRHVGELSEIFDEEYEANARKRTLENEYDSQLEKAEVKAVELPDNES